MLKTDWASEAFKDLLAIKAQTALDSKAPLVIKAWTVLDFKALLVTKVRLALGFEAKASKVSKEDYQAHKTNNVRPDLLYSLLPTFWQYQIKCQ